MNGLIIVNFFAATGLDPSVTPANRGGKLPPFLFSDMGLIIMAGVALGLGVALWARMKFRGRAPSYKGKIREELVEREGEEVLKVKKRHRRKRREHRQRNPTLSETGGLPPARPDGSAPRGL